ncbi:MAG TPA: SPOR domain-containing protein [Arenimonas sp.]|uniref:SPOR domain-containing protein n=1 Tax=Arenimonas sp. TaxID=1872635 RepID=UPI002D7E2D47|nr:SPOR domain-containing protein [Arenimonas sp.]HEU0152982.1 SPOR domain-containing protein [Arenimonas sp.]
MDSALKQRLIGAAVLVALAMIFLPMLLKGPDVSGPDAAEVPLDMPAAPDQAFETREVPLTLPAPEAPDGGVLGLSPRPVASDDPNAVATVDQTALPPARTEVAPEPEDGPLAAVDAATGLPAPAAPSAPDPTPAPTPAPTPTPEPVVTAPPPAPAAAPAPALPAATAGGRYMVNVGSFSNLANARSLADKLRSRGLPLTSESVDVAGKPAMRLRVGPYGDRTAAEAARLRVESVTGGSAAVVTLDAAVAGAPAPARASTAPTVGFAVQLGAFSTEADANALRDRARAAGFVAFHQRMNTDRGAVWRVRVGPEADRASADRLLEAVRSRLSMPEAIVVPHP